MLTIYLISNLYLSENISSFSFWKERNHWLHPINPNNCYLTFESPRRVETLGDLGYVLYDHKFKAYTITNFRNYMFCEAQFSRCLSEMNFFKSQVKSGSGTGMLPTDRLNFFPLSSQFNSSKHINLIYCWAMSPPSALATVPCEDIIPFYLCWVLVVMCSECFIRRQVHEREEDAGISPTI